MIAHSIAEAALRAAIWFGCASFAASIGILALGAFLAWRRGPAWPIFEDDPHAD